MGGCLPVQQLARGSGRGQLYNDITETVGNTPCVKLNDRMAPPGRTIYCKLEYFNPLSSVKDRLALAIIEDGEKKGLLKPGMTVIEATSGNTGIAVAMICAQRGYKCVICMAETFSIERRKLMRMLGAKVILTPKAGKGTGMVKKAAELAEAHGWFLCHQFESEANPAFHAATTGPEIINDFKGKRLDYFVLGYGTGGTYAGAGKAIKKARPNVKICLAEPEAAGLVKSGVKTNRKPDGAAVDSHPAFNAHPIQGWTPDFIPKILEDGVDSIGYDEYMPIPGPKAIETSQPNPTTAPTSLKESRPPPRRKSPFFHPQLQPRYLGRLLQLQRVVRLLRQRGLGRLPHPGALAQTHRLRGLRPRLRRRLLGRSWVVKNLRKPFATAW